MQSDNRPIIEIQQVSKSFGEKTALADINLSVKKGEFVTILGPSGCGKTTLLRLIAGFHDASSGTIRINGEDMPQQVVKSRFLKLNSSHIEYVLEAMNKNPSDIRNIRAYLLTALYNASLTIDNYYSALVNHDFYGQDRSAGSKKPKTYDYSLCEDTL